MRQGDEPWVLLDDRFRGPNVLGLPLFSSKGNAGSWEQAGGDCSPVKEGSTEGWQKGFRKNNVLGARFKVLGRPI